MRFPSLPAGDVVGLVPAAGVGRRYGDREPKQFLEIGGKSLVRWSVDRLRLGGVGRIVVALPAGVDSGGHLGDVDELVVVEGGATRQESVERCLRAAEINGPGLVAVHDAARGAADPGDVRRVLAAATRSGGAVLGRPVGDTIKRLRDGTIVGTVDRENLWHAETPQVFRADLLLAALAKAKEEGFVGTDESSLVERYGEIDVQAVTAEHPNPKLTWPGDELWIGALLEVRGA